jgi:intracellular sulfur oxidation DsrE/DsrF family protein
MVTDKNKKNITTLANHLNLPIKIVFENDETKKIEYIYNATGVKLFQKK